MVVERQGTVLVSHGWYSLPTAVGNRRLRGAGGATEILGDLTLSTVYSLSRCRYAALRQVDFYLNARMAINRETRDQPVRRPEHAAMTPPTRPRLARTCRLFVVRAVGAPSRIG
jgi:hypothetical protein